jgi:archaemetzincin
VVELELSRARLLKVITHETTHLFDVRHCLNYACNMNGVETVDEIDRHPLELCPECMAMVCWTTQVHPAERYEKLATVCREIGLPKDASFYDACQKALNGIGFTSS